MQTDELRPYWEGLWKKRKQLFLKRLFDFFIAIFLLVLLSIPMAFIAMLIKKEDLGPVFFRQERITAYGKRFRIHKFRTMVTNIDQNDNDITVKDDPRVTKVGKKLRQFKLDELPQLLDVIAGDMSFVGTRPEAEKYVRQYKPEYNATLLMPAGITSEASIRYRNEDELLDSISNVDKFYVKKILPGKMKLNLKYTKTFSFFSDIVIMFCTVFSVFGNKS